MKTTSSLITRFIAVLLIPVFVVLSMPLAAYANQPSVTISVTGTSGNPCLGTALSISGGGVINPASDNQIGQYKIQVIWDVNDLINGTQSGIPISTTDTASPFNYTFTAGPHTYTGIPPATVKIRIYHSTPPGNDNQADSVTTVPTCPPNNAPVANNDSYSTNEDTILNVPASGVLGNDTDAESNPLTAVFVSNPASGVLTLNSDGSFSYTPNTNFNGLDSFTYKANDGTSNSNIATVSITVVAVNDPPVANDDAYSTDEDTTLNVSAPGVLTNDADIEGDSLSAVLVSNVSDGTLTLNGDGSFSYTPDSGFNGTDTFTYKANDGSVDGNTATVTITVDSTNDTPVANADSYSTDEDTTLNVSALGVLTNDADADGDSLTAVLVDNVSNGTLTLNSDGSFSYTPNANFNGTDSFAYKANDGTVNSGEAIVTITVNFINDAPVANDDSYATDEDTTLNVPAAGVLANDTDVESSLSAILVSDVSNGTLTVNSDGSFTYAPDTDFNGSDFFTYKANDGTDDSNVATVSITINSISDSQCDDGIDNDSDSFTDFPADPGCSGVSDNDETDPVVPPPAPPSPPSPPSDGGGLSTASTGSGARSLTVQPQGEVLGEAVCSVEYLKEYIKLGKKNNPAEVKKLQEFLNINLGLSLAVTGFYGPQTFAAVNQFQTKYGEQVLAPWMRYGHPNAQTPTGYVYKTTKRWINMLNCPDLNLPIPPLP